MLLVVYVKCSSAFSCEDEKENKKIGRPEKS